MTPPLAVCAAVTSPRRPGAWSGVAFNGAGDTRTPMIINLLSFWIFKLPLAYVLSVHVAGMEGARGVFTAIFAAYSLNAVLAFGWLRGGRWKMRVV